MLITNDYSIVFSEVDEIFNYLSLDLLEKIPKKLRDATKKFKNEDYVFKYDVTKSLEQQNIHEQTKNFISAIYLTYICSNEKKESLISICKNNDLEKEKAIREKYNPDNIFKNPDKSKNENIEKINDVEGIETNTSLVEYKKSIISRLFNKIKNFFKK